MKLQLLTAFSAIWSKAWPILIAILFFGFIIFIHEFGHFIFAKLFGVKVNEFALGMGPTIFKKQGKETKYALRLFPIGGFVSMEGEDENSEDERAFCNKKVWKRMIIVVAGATFNIILGVIICIAIIGSSDLVGTNKVLQFYDSAVSNSDGGLMVDDKILEIDGKKVYSDFDISFLMQRNNTGKYHFVVERNGEKTDLPEVNFDVRTGGNFSHDKDRVISSLSANMKKAGLEDGDQIVKINGKKVNSQEEVVAAIGEDEDFTIDFTVMRNQGEVEVKNVTMATVTVFDFIMLGEEKNVGNVISGGVKYAVSMSRMVYLSLFDLIGGRYGLNDLSGPIGTVSVIADVAQSGTQGADWSQLITIMALITINIGLFNLLPIPALDGGRFFFMLIELIFRKPVPAKYENWIHAAGMIILFAFMAIVSASDIWKLVSGRGFY
ncbi:MAG: RIP metalloprotease RseP [Faecalibacterium sp.]|nr:RIP metalloprotease RseP [Ruminococcus sp.]MCM1392003.1 RIP metalloprotease RseP [Ruminococcus sp.]MCM1485737.1 RIP metalloprotease RseP [Faecalibacterium sp.]